MPVRPEIPYIVVPFAAAFIVAALFGPGVIGMLRRKGFGERISEDGPESHRRKEGTPTMGGLIILAGILGGVLVYLLVVSGDSQVARDPSHRVLFASILLVCAFGVLGVVDDIRSMRPAGGVRGISSRPKAAIQIVLASAFVFWLFKNGAEALMVGCIPALTGWAYGVFAVLYIVGMANFVNITDGLDGLAAGLVAVACTAFGLIIQWHGAAPETIEASVLLWAAAGACLAFLWFNCNPAAVFMGDTGSLALGVLLPVVAILAHREVLMLVVGGVFVVEGASTVVQWGVFKLTRVTTGSGRRVFRKSPIHHHFELCGWSEQKVVARFWIAGVLCAVVGFAGSLLGYW